jgi:hypothetical protein
MAITTLNKDGSYFESRQGANVPYVAECIIDFAEALVAKGSALAADDIIETIYMPAGTVILNAGLQCMVADDATTLTLHLGITGGDIDEYVVSFDHAAAAAGAYAPQLATDPTWNLITTADTLDIELATLTGTLTSGKVRVWALLVDVNNAKKQPGIAQVGS